MTGLAGWWSVEEELVQMPAGMSSGKQVLAEMLLGMAAGWHIVRNGSRLVHHHEKIELGNLSEQNPQRASSATSLAYVQSEAGSTTEAFTAS